MNEQIIKNLQLQAGESAAIRIVLKAMLNAHPAAAAIRQEILERQRALTLSPELGRWPKSYADGLRSLLDDLR